MVIGHNDKLLAIPLILLAALTASSRASALQQQAPGTPTFRVEVRADLLTEFTARVSSYVDLRSELEKGLPPVTVTDPAEASKAVLALATAIRKARAGAKEGDIFTPAIRVELKRVLGAEMNEVTWAALSDDNPGEFTARINSSYPNRQPLSTVPPNILEILPMLPEDIEYRFLGRDLILLDTRANVVVDRMPGAVQGAGDRPWWRRALGAIGL